GRLLVSALRHGGRTNAAGHWLLDRFVKHLADGPAPAHALAAGTRSFLRQKVQAQSLELVHRPWRFKPDPKGDGLARGWHKPDALLDSSWKEIRIGRNWESQGYPDLDGWAWYRLDVEIPRTWAGRSVYLTFEGVDDYYELFVNGQPAGKG